MAAFETMLQLVQPAEADGGARLVAGAGSLIVDAPERPHRGVLVDSGKRFFPPSLLRNLLDGMAASKLNVLHLHLSDWCSFTLASDELPELTAGLPDGMFYTKGVHTNTRAASSSAQTQRQ